MTILRILTGPHAGAQVQLTPGVLRIGADAAADIRLTDWYGLEALLEMDHAGLVSITRIESTDRADNRDEAGSVWLKEWVPMQFDDVVLCLGPADSAWPSDVDLLSTLLANPVKRELASVRHEQNRRRKTLTVIGLIGLGCVIVGGALLETIQLSGAARPSTPADRASQIEQVFSQAHITGLHAQAIGNTVVVSGMVVTPADDVAVRTLLTNLGPYGVQRRYDVAQLDAHSIEDSVGIAGIRVDYIGDSRFALYGRVVSQGEVEAALARVRADLSPNVKGIVVRTEQAASAAREDSQKYSEVVSSEDVEYTETPDGVKHILAFEPASGASSVPDADPYAAASDAVGASAERPDEPPSTAK